MFSNSTANNAKEDENMTEKEVTIKRDKLNIRGTLTTPNGLNSYNLAILMHGFTSNRGFSPDHILVNLSGKLLKENIATLRFDFNGSGKSDGNFKDMTVVNEIADAEAVLNYVRKLKEVNKIFLMGHSQGGVVASMLAGLYPEYISKVVLMAPAATLKDDAQKGVLQGVTYDPVNIPDLIPINLGVNLAVGGAYIRSAQVLPIYEVAQRYHGPVCIIYGDHDTIVDIKAPEKYKSVYDNASLHILKNADHGFHGDSREKVTALAAKSVATM